MAKKGMKTKRKRRLQRRERQQAQQTVGVVHEQTS